MFYVEHNGVAGGVDLYLLGNSGRGDFRIDGLNAADALQRDHLEIESLGKLVYQKTDGNPFFAGELLKNFYQEGSIFFRSAVGKWDWEMKRVERAEVSGNVVEIMITNLTQVHQHSDTKSQ